MPHLPPPFSPEAGHSVPGPLQTTGISPSGGGGFSEEDFFALLAQLDLGGGGGGGGGFGPLPFASSQAGLELQGQIQARLEELRQKGALTLQERREAFELEQQMKRLEQQRQILFAQQKGIDPVRAVLLGLGVGGQLTPEGTRFEGLAPLKGAERFRTDTQAALSGLLGGRDISIGSTGVEGLPSAEKTARAFQFGGGGEKTLLTSAFGVGSESLGGGLQAEDFVRRIQQVTPTGIL